MLDFEMFDCESNLSTFCSMILLSLSSSLNGIIGMDSSFGIDSTGIVIILDSFRVLSSTLAFFID